MAAKTPVISTNSGGLPEVNVQGVTGFLSPVGDIDDMANNAVNILKDDAVLLKFKKAAFEHSKTFEIAKILPKYEAIYRAVKKGCC